MSLKDLNVEAGRVPPISFRCKSIMRRSSFSLYIAFDVGDLHQEEFEELLDTAEEVARIVGGLHARWKDKETGNAEA